MLQSIFGFSKNPEDVVKKLKDALQTVDSNMASCNIKCNNSTTNNKRQEKALEDISKLLQITKTLLLGSEITDASNGKVVYQVNHSTVMQLACAVYNSGIRLHEPGVLLLLLENLQKIDFEGKKNVVQIFNNLLCFHGVTAGTKRFHTVDYICTNRPVIIITLCQGYEKQEIALSCGAMLRQCIRHKSLAKILLQSEEFFKLFEYVVVQGFDIAADAFTTFTELLTTHTKLIVDFFEANFDKFFQHYHELLQSESYLTRRQSLKLLGQIICNKNNRTLMTRYISNPANLKRIMNLLKQDSKNIAYEAFHVFKVFVANPNKPKPILNILTKNREKLVLFLTNFDDEQPDEDLFKEEKATLIHIIEELNASETPEAPLL